MKTKYLIISNLFFISLLFFAFQKAEENQDLSLCNTAVSVGLMNKFYIGAENPIQIAAPNELPLEAIRTVNCELKKTKNCNEFLVTATKTGKSEILVHKQGKKLTGKEKSSDLLKFEFKNIMLPDPVISLKEKFKGKRGLIRSGEMKAQRGLLATVPGVEAKAKVESFKVTFAKKRTENPFTYIVEGNRFKGEVLEQVQRCKPGDVIYFEDIKVRCPGDKVARLVEGFDLKIK